MAWGSLPCWGALGTLLWVLAYRSDFFGAVPETRDAAKPGKPHIIFVLQDDLGWHDIGFHNPSMIEVSKHVTSLAKDGLVLTNHLTHFHCSPTRRSFLSGRLPIHHSEGLSGVAADDLDLRWSLISDKMKTLGYRTHWVGKAHTGFLSTAHLPTKRGFDSYLGYLSGAQSYTSSDRWKDDGPCNNETYSTELFGQRALEVVKKHPVDEPLFMYLAWQAVHSPYDTVPGYDCDTTAFEPYPGTYAQMLHATDDQMGLLVEALKERGMWDNTLLVYTSDNGGVAEHGLAGNNYPLRGEKHSNWAGGYRTATFMSGGYLPNKLRGESSNLRMHIVDWYPTFCMLGGGDAKSCSDDPAVAPQPTWIAKGDGVQCAAGSHIRERPHRVDSLEACQSEAESMGHPFVQFESKSAESPEDAGGFCLTLPQCGPLRAHGSSKVFWRDHYGKNSYPALDGVDVWPLLAGTENVDDYAAHPTLVVSAQVILDRELKLLVGQGMVDDSGQKTRPDWDGNNPPTDGWRLANGSWVSATSVGWTCGLTYGLGVAYQPCLFDEDRDRREQEDLAPQRTADVARLWRMLNSSNLAAFHARSPSSLLGHCDSACAKQHWKALNGSGDGPVCGVPGCDGNRDGTRGKQAVVV